MMPRDTAVPHPQHQGWMLSNLSLSSASRQHDANLTCFFSSLRELPCILCAWARPVLLPMRVLASSCTPGSILQALLCFSIVTTGPCKVVHSVSISCLPKTRKKPTCNWLRKTDVCLRLIWLCSFRRILKVPHCLLHGVEAFSLFASLLLY